MDQPLLLQYLGCHNQQLIKKNTNYRIHLRALWDTLGRAHLHKTTHNKHDCLIYIL